MASSADGIDGVRVARVAQGRQAASIDPSIDPFDSDPELSYTVYVSTTITIRTDETLREALDKKAATSGKTVSELVREILEEALAEKPLQVRAGHLKGRLSLPRKASEPWRSHLRQRNWRS